MFFFLNFGVITSVLRFFDKKKVELYDDFFVTEKSVVFMQCSGLP